MGKEEGKSGCRAGMTGELAREELMSLSGFSGPGKRSISGAGLLLYRAGKSAMARHNQ
jgi:hypothetical protein